MPLELELDLWFFCIQRKWNVFGPYLSKHRIGPTPSSSALPPSSHDIHDKAVAFFLCFCLGMLTILFPKQIWIIAPWFLVQQKNNSHHSTKIVLEVDNINLLTCLSLGWSVRTKTKDQVRKEKENTSAETGKKLIFIKVNLTLIKILDLTFSQGGNIDKTNISIITDGYEELFVSTAKKKGEESQVQGEKIYLIWELRTWYSGYGDTWILYPALYMVSQSTSRSYFWAQLGTSKINIMAIQCYGKCI